MHIYLRTIPIFRLLTLHYYRLIAKKITEVQRERLAYLFQEGDTVDYIYIVQSGEFKVTKKELVPNESYKDEAIEEILAAPLITAQHNCEYMTKNKKKVTKTVTLEHLGEKSVIGLQDLLSGSPVYTMSMMCIS